MTWLAANLELLLRASAVLQMSVALLALGVSRILGWPEDLARVPLLIRQVVAVHTWLVALTLAIFAVITWRFASELALNGSDLARWIAGAIGCFWAFRTTLQIAYFSSDHWRGQVNRTIVHVSLFAAYGAMSLIYVAACLGAGR